MHSFYNLALSSLFLHFWNWNSQIRFRNRLYNMYDIYINGKIHCSSYKFKKLLVGWWEFTPALFVLIFSRITTLSTYYLYKFSEMSVYIGTILTLWENILISELMSLRFLWNQIPFNQKSYKRPRLLFCTALWIPLTFFCPQNSPIEKEILHGW